jgi:hypothetical protein
VVDGGKRVLLEVVERVLLEVVKRVLLEVVERVLLQIVEAGVVLFSGQDQYQSHAVVDGTTGPAVPLGVCRLHPVPVEERPNAGCKRISFGTRHESRWLVVSLSH